MATRKKQSTESVVKGNHLTVTTHPDGSTTLTWDDEALRLEVREAIANFEMQELTTTAKTKGAVKAKKQKPKNEE
jgi:YD repeat-containing protein